MTTDPRQGARDVFWELHDSKGYTCPGCGASREETTAMHVHHLDGNPRNNSRGNLVALCNQCHLGGVHDLDVDDPRLSKPSVNAPRPTASIFRPGAADQP
jgi:5-methylcytosine-specific restriction endonuclease McrA